MSELYEKLLQEFGHMKACAMKIGSAFTPTMALPLVEMAPDSSSYHKGVQMDSVSVGRKITYRWIQCFMQVNNLVIRAQTGKHTISSEKQNLVERSVAYHLGTLKRTF